MPSTSAASDAVEAVEAEKGQMKILDLVKSDDNSMAKCLVECMDTHTREWIAVDDIKKSYPRLLIDYYESRIKIVPQN